MPPEQGETSVREAKRDNRISQYPQQLAEGSEAKRALSRPDHLPHYAVRQMKRKLAIYRFIATPLHSEDIVRIVCSLRWSIPIWNKHTVRDTTAQAHSGILVASTLAPIVRVRGFHTDSRYADKIDELFFRSQS